MRGVIVLILLLGCIYSSNVVGQHSNFKWAAGMGGPLDEIGHSVAVDDSGNVYVTGAYRKTVDFDPGVGTFYLTSTGETDIFVQKLSPQGGLIWAKSMGGNKDDYGYYVCTDAAGHVYVTGLFQGEADFDPGADTFSLISAGYASIFVQKLDPSGELIWAMSIGAHNDNGGRAMTTDASGNVFVTGFFSGRVDFDPGMETSYLASKGEGDIFVQKLDSSGAFIWAKSVGGDFTETGLSITTDEMENVYVAGHFQGTVDFDSETGTEHITSRGGSDIYVMKLDPSGDFIWVRTVGGRSHESAKSIAIDALNNVYVTGVFQDTVDFDPGPETNYLTATEGIDVFIQKLSTTGDFLWARSITGSGWNEGRGITTDTLGNVYVTGFFEDTIHFNRGGRNEFVGSHGYVDIFVQKLDYQGRVAWTEVIGGKGGDAVNSIASDGKGNIYIVGHYADTVDFDPGTGTSLLASAGMRDMLLVKLGIATRDESANNIKRSISIYPNPSDGKFTVDLGKEYEQVELEVFDIGGRSLQKSSYHRHRHIDMQIDASPGGYFLVISSEEGQAVIRLMKE